MSVAGVVLANGLNANQMHRWMRERGIAPPSWRKPACAERTGLVAQPGFVPVQDAPSVEPPVIRLEAQRGKARSRAVAWGLRPAVGQNGSFCLIMPCHAPKRPRRQPTHGRQQAAISGRREDFPQPAVRCGTDGLRAGVVNPPGLTCAALPLTSEGRQRIKR